jgi:hypothetical protein
MRYAILMLTTFTFSMSTGLQAVPQQADAEAILVGYVHPVTDTSSTPDPTTLGTTGTFDNGVVVDPFGAHLVTICTSLAKAGRVEPSGLAGPIVRCEMPVTTTELWAFNAKTGAGDRPEARPQADRPATISDECPAK